MTEIKEENTKIATPADVGTKRRRRRKKKLGQEEQESIIADIPVYPALMNSMKIGLMTNEASHVMLIHNKPLPNILRWAEYDTETTSLTFVMEGGKIQDSGLKVAPDIEDDLLDATELYAVQTNDDGTKVRDIYLVPLAVREADLI